MKEYLPYLTVIVTAGSFLFAVFKYLHGQKESRKNKRFDQFRQVFEWVAGTSSNGIRLQDTQQAMAVYQLSEFPEYSYMSLPIINYYLINTKDDSDDSLLRASLLEAKARLQTKPNKSA